MPSKNGNQNRDYASSAKYIFKTQDTGTFISKKNFRNSV